jgi:APA family basic amino acid/polyamine antiporter
MRTDDKVAFGLARQLGPFDATMIVMGGIIGSGIFMNSYVVARQVHTAILILGVWLFGGLIALAGAFVYAELTARSTQVGGQYAWLREAYHPAVAFLYGWALLLVIQTGGMAAIAITFARYFIEITHVSLSDRAVAALALAMLAAVNCFGVKTGSAVQNVLMVVKIMAITALVICGLLLVGVPRFAVRPVLDRPFSLGLFAALGAAMTPVMFAYGGWQTATFVAGEMRNPRKDLSRGLLAGVAGVVVLYLTVNIVYLGVLGAGELAQTVTPASSMMRLALGERGSALIAVAIGISTFGFLSHGILTAPRVYFAMAEDRLFFKGVAWLHPRTRVPVVAIVLQGALAAMITVWGRYEQILNYVVSVDFIGYGLTATCLFIFRRTEPGAGNKDSAGYRVPGHPVTTLFFIAACWLVVVSTLYTYPRNSAIGLGIVLAGIPVYFFWRWWRSEE